MRITSIIYQVTVYKKQTVVPVELRDEDHENTGIHHESFFRDPLGLVHEIPLFHSESPHLLLIEFDYSNELTQGMVGQARPVASLEPVTTEEIVHELPLLLQGQFYIQVVDHDS
jgi:hypothetical protein